MTEALLDEILAQAAAFSPKPRIGFAYTEPLIHARILDFCRSIVRRGSHCAITTNGFMLPRLAHPLVKIGVQENTVSVDGPGQVHDRIRGRAGSFEALYRGVAELGRAKALLVDMPTVPAKRIKPATTATRYVTRSRVAKRTGSSRNTPRPANSQIRVIQ